MKDRELTPEEIQRAETERRARAAAEYLRLLEQAARKPAAAPARPRRRR